MADTQIVNILLNLRENVSQGSQRVQKSVDNLRGSLDNLTGATERNRKAQENLNETEKKVIANNDRAAARHRSNANLVNQNADAHRAAADALDNENQSIRNNSSENARNITSHQRQISALEGERGRRGANIESIDREIASHQRSITQIQNSNTVHGRLGNSMSNLGERVRNLTRDQNNSSSAFGRGRRMLGLIRQEMTDNSRSAEILSRRLSRLGRSFLGLGIASVIIFSQSLLSTITALGGQVISLASSLAFAAGALGGVFVSAIAQAIPVVGLLAGVMQRLSLVQQAVNEHSLVQKQDSRQTQEAFNQQRSAANALIDAQQGLIDAQRNLTQARRDARRELQDLILAEEKGRLSARDSQVALRAAAQSGDVGALQQAQLDARTNRLTASRSRQDLGIARAGAPGSPQDKVTQATNQLASATRALADAHIQAAQAASRQSAAESYLAYFNSLLSPAERRLAKTINNLQDNARKLLTPVTDNIINSFTFAIKSVQKMLLSPQILNGFKKLSSGIGGLMNDMTKLFTNNKSMQFWTFMLREGRRNLGPIEKILKNVFVIFRNIATAAAPVLHKLLKLIANETGRWAKSTGDLKGLTDFFFTGLKHLRAWWGLLKAILKLFGALMGVSGPSAIKTLTTLTETINGATAALKGDPKGAGEFFDKSAKSISYLGGVVVALGQALVDSFDPATVKSLADVLKNVFIPGLAQGIKFLGIFAKILDVVTSNPVAAKILELAIAFSVLRAGLGILSPLIGGLLGPLWSIVDAVGQSKKLWTNSTPTMTKFYRLLKSGLSTAADAASNWISNFTTGLKMGGTKVRNAFRRMLLRITLWTTAATTAAATFADALTKAINVRFAKLAPLFKRWGGRFGIALGIGLITLGLTDESLRNQAKDAFMSLVAIFADAWQAVINLIIDGLNKLPFINDIGHFDWRQKEKDKIARGETSLFRNQVLPNEAQTGHADTRDLTPKQMQQRAQQSQISHLKDIASGATPSTPAAQRSAQKELRKLGVEIDNTNKKQKNLNDTTSKGAAAINNYAGNVKKASNQSSNLKDNIKGASSKLDDHKNSAKRATNALGPLGDTLSGVGNTARDMADMFGKATNKVLISFGAKKIAYTLPPVIPPHARPLGGTFAGGGYFGDPRLRNKDDRMIGVAGGEAILTGHHQKATNMAMSFANAAGVIPYRNLHDMFRKDKREHRTAGFARGGMVDPSWDPGGEVLNSSISNIVGQWARRFKADMTAGYDPGGGHLSPGHNVTGTATDMVPGAGGTWGKLEKGLALLVQSGFEVLYDGRVGTVPYPNHGRGNHAHIEWVGNGSQANAIQRLENLGFTGAGGPVAAAVEKIKRMVVKGPAGALKNALQGQADTLRKQANKYISKHAAKGGKGLGMGDSSVGSRQWERINSGTLGFNQLVRLASDVGMHNPTLMAHIAEAESTGHVDVINSIGATGLWQIYNHPDLVAKYGRMTNAWHNAQAAKALLQGAPGFQPQGLSAWAASQGTWGRFAQRGGMIPRFGDGGVIPGPIGSPQLMVGHGGETVLPTHKFQFGGIVGQGLDTVRELLKGNMSDLAKAGKTVSRAPVRKFTKVIDALNALTADSGTFSLLADQLDKLSTLLTLRTNQAVVQLRGSIVSQVVSNVDKARLSLGDLQTIGTHLTDELVDITKLIKNVKQRIKKTKDKKKKRDLRTALQGIIDKGVEIADQYTQNLMDQLDAQNQIWDEVMSRFEQRLSDLDIQNQILDIMGQISGIPDAAGLKANLQAQAGVLNEERAAIQAELAQATAAGNVELIRQLNTSLLENQLALLNNTKTMKELDGTLGATFSFNTTAWQVWRRAVLNGMGGLLPQFMPIPSLQTGGEVIRSGLVNLHAGEVVHEKNAGPVEQHYHFTEPMQVADPTVIGAELGWKWKQTKV